ncbi:hypothetical protein LHFGNBLO_001994 [Mesorhizobium sp. AR10]|uniref:hypothetical protein n=1 Tax=Mesorhizobium sp. AR10 TaxID=2865839 RepID=UPI00215F0A18|nr:hypothetical protein [Mesorhizobium sp. AR10]UVK40522.1 hypothetical protein LHFGNBLO_001994 [Mesorhizobium sp. AR10]
MEIAMIPVTGLPTDTDVGQGDAFTSCCSVNSNSKPTSTLVLTPTKFFKYFVSEIIISLRMNITQRLKDNL